MAGHRKLDRQSGLRERAVSVLLEWIMMRASLIDARFTNSLRRDLAGDRRDLAKVACPRTASADQDASLPFPARPGPGSSGPGSLAVCRRLGGATGPGF